MKNVAKIPLSGKISNGSYALVDVEDVELVAGIRWHLNDMGYAVNRTGGKTLRMHRLINKTPDGLFTDHKNHDRLDNRKSNLRTVTQAENMANYKGAKGYAWDKSKQKYIVRVGTKFCGRYKTKEEAKDAYKRYSSGQEYVPQRRKLYHLPTGISKQFGKYRVRPQVNGKRTWLGAYATLAEAEQVLKKWRER